MHKKIIFFLFITLFGLQLLVQNSQPLMRKIFDLRRSFIIEKSSSFTSLTLSKKEWLLHKNFKEIKIDNNYYDVKKITHKGETVDLIVIEDKNENLIKYITHNLKNENSKKNKTKLKRSLVFVIHSEEADSNFNNLPNSLENNFYTYQKKYCSSIQTTFRPPIV
jgi:hypothetical protein